MGMLMNGVWTDDSDVVRTDPTGEWKRTPSVYRNWITSHGGDRFVAEPGRYHLYAAWNCPWAHRALLARVALGLKDMISVSFVAPRRTRQGWVFSGEYADDLFGADALHQVYTRGHADYTGRVTVPLLWDRKTETAVSNESADIVRMLNQSFGPLVEGAPGLYPEELRPEIDAWNDRIHPGLNNGVYRTGFASTQEAYDAGVATVFETLDAIEAVLADRPYLTGDQFTEADLRIFPTLVRFDAAYFQAFKCSRNRLTDFPNLWEYARRLYHRPDFAGTVRFDIYRAGYNSPSEKRNPHGIIPVAPEIDWALD